MRGQLNQVNRAFVKRVKALQKQRERGFFDRLETKAIGEQQRMIKFEKNSNQRSGTKMLHLQNLSQYSAYFASMLIPVLTLSIMKPRLPLSPRIARMKQLRLLAKRS